jgi:hypothetical protein
MAKMTIELKTASCYLQLTSFSQNTHTHTHTSLNNFSWGGRKTDLFSVPPSARALVDGSFRSTVFKAGYKKILIKKLTLSSLKLFFGSLFTIKKG